MIKNLKQIIPDPLKEIILDKSLYYQYSSLSRRNNQLQSIKKTDKAFIIATGPSVQNKNLSVLKNYDSFTLSNAFLHPQIDKINPQLHFFAPFHKPLKKSNFIKWYKRADNELPPQTSIVLGHKDYQLVQENNLFTDRKVYYLILSPYLRRPIDPTKTILSPQSVPLMALPVLLYLNYEKIYLLGCDHNTLKDYDNENIRYFYPNNQDERKNSSKTISLKDELRSYLRLFNQYKEYKKILKPDQEIINLSMRSWLEYFSKKKLADVI